MNSSATTIEQARRLETRGIDGIIAQGLEADGHRGLFLNRDLNSQLGTLPVMREIVSAVKRPVIAAGGVQVGTACLSSPEASTSAIHRSALRDRGPRVAALTNVFTVGSRPAMHHAPCAMIRALMSTSPHCPQCRSDVTYEDGTNFVCAECAHEWPKAGAASEPDSDVRQVRDSNGNPLADGDTVVVIKDLKVKGSSSSLKAGTKVKGIRLVEGDHDIDCRIEGFGAMKLKSEFVKKA